VERRTILRASMEFECTDAYYSACVPGKCACKGTAFLRASFVIVRAKLPPLLHASLEIWRVQGLTNLRASLVIMRPQGHNTLRASLEILRAQGRTIL
jgi:hypothetical protein